MDDEPVGRTADKSAVDLEFSLFYRQEMPRLVAFLLVKGAFFGHAQDAAQEAMTEAYRRWDDLDHPRAWIRTVASRAWWRARGDSTERLGERDPVASGEEHDEIDNKYVLLAALRSLPAGQREVMAWTYDGFTPTEIAAQLGIPAPTVRSRLREARASLRKRRGPDEVQP